MQRAFGGQHQFGQCGAQVGRAGIQLINDDLLIAGGQHAAQLATAAIALLGEVAFGRQRRLGSAWHAGQISIQDLPRLRIIVPVALTVLAIDLVQRLLQLTDIVRRAGVQRLLHHRLLGTGCAAKGSLERRIAAQAGVDLHQPMRTRQDGNPGIVQLIQRRSVSPFSGQS